MFKPVRMCKINILLLQKHLNVITTALAQGGVVHLVDAAAQSKDRLSSAVDLSQEKQQLQKMLDRCRLLMEAIGVDKDAPAPRIETLDKEEIEMLLGKVSDKYKKFDQEIAALLEDTAQLSQESERLGEFPLQTVPLHTLRNLSHFYMVTGKMRLDTFLRARQILENQALLLRSDDDSSKVLVLSSRSNRWMVEEDLNKLGFEKIEIPENLDGEINGKQKEFHDQIDELRNKLNQSRLGVLRLGEQYGGALLAIKRQLKTLLAVQQAQSMFGKSRQIYCISGWVPKDKVEQVREIVRLASDGVGIVEVIDADQDELVKAGLDQVPVKLQASALEKPFQMLVTNYSIPNYSEFDPSFFVSITFVIMFGYMFGDIGQGATLAVIGLFLRFSKRNFQAVLRDTGTLLIFCGLSATFFGFCYGSVFGFESHQYLPPLWLSPLHEQDIPRLLLTAVGMGVIFLSVAVIINIVNHFLAHKYFAGTFDKFGLLGILFYWAVLAIGIQLAVSKKFASWQLIFVAIPLLLLFLREPLHNLIHHRNPFYRSSIMDVILEGCIELMETLTGYLSGTVSFVRVGAFAISHAALCMAVFTVIGMLKGITFGTLLSIIVAILGNLLIIVFEGMVAAIQCIRLEYYELFSRFFQGGGKAYEPFQIAEQTEEK
jgi:V/A-type H+-transporting ATPase subunit I